MTIDVEVARIRLMVNELTPSSLGIRPSIFKSMILYKTNLNIQKE